MAPARPTSPALWPPALGPGCQVLAELTDAEGEHVAAQVISALSAGGSFLRTGHPLTETFALMALKVREYELVMQMATPPPIVLEDRGVDTWSLVQQITPPPRCGVPHRS